MIKMKDFAIIYSSKTGNTKKIAEVFYAVAADRCDLMDVKEAGDVGKYKVVFAGYWVDRGAPNAEMQKFLSSLQNMRVVFFQTLGAEPYSEHGMTCFANAGKFLTSDCNVLGVFSCRGAIDPALIAAMEKMPAGSPHAPTPESRKRWQDASTHPDDKDIDSAKAYMQKFIAFYDKFYR